MWICDWDQSPVLTKHQQTETNFNLSCHCFPWLAGQFMPKCEQSSFCMVSWTIWGDQILLAFKRYLLSCFLHWKEWRKKVSKICFLLLWPTRCLFYLETSSPHTLDWIPDFLTYIVSRNMLGIVMSFCFKEHYFQYKIVPNWWSECLKIFLISLWAISISLQENP